MFSIIFYLRVVKIIHEQNKNKKQKKKKTDNVLESTKTCVSDKVVVRLYSFKPWSHRANGRVTDEKSFYPFISVLCSFLIR